MAALLFALPRILYTAVSEQAVKNAEVMGQQTLSEINELIEKLDTYGDYVSTNSSLRKLIYSIDDPKIAMQLQNEFSNMHIIDNYLVSAGIIISDSATVKSYGVTETDISEINSNWFRNYRKYGYLKIFHISYNATGEVEKLYYVIRIENFIGEKVDMVLVCSISPFIQYLSALNSSDSNFALLDSDTNCIYSNSSQLGWVDSVKQTITLSPVHETIYENDDGFNIIYNTSFGGWHLVLNMSRDSLLAPYQKTINATIIAVSLFFIILQIGLVTMLFRILKPVRSLSELMHKAAEGDLSVRADINTGDEIEMLGNCFNYMTYRLNENINKLLEQEKIEQRMKYSLLISQIDPHFIYNTMNSITYLAKNKRNDDVIIINRKLMDILKDSLRINDVEFFDSLERELEIVNSYIVIQQYRYGDSFEIKWEVSEEILKSQIPKNIIQPIVENGLFHGLLSNKDEDGSIIGGLINIKAYRGDENMCIEVSDNGKGMDENKVEAFNSGLHNLNQPRGEHIGLINIRERLKYLYKNDFEMKIESASGKGTVVRIKFKEQE
jgi:sensor histidine kinase YesM